MWSHIYYFHCPFWNFTATICFCRIHKEKKTAWKLFQFSPFVLHGMKKKSEAWNNMRIFFFFFGWIIPLTGDTSLGCFPENVMYWVFFYAKDNKLVRVFFFCCFFCKPCTNVLRLAFFSSSTECDITQGLCSYSQCKLKLKLCVMTSGITEWPDLLQSSNVSCHCFFFFFF